MQSSDDLKDEAIYLSDEIHVFTARPGRIKAKITVDLPRPRIQAEVTTSSDFVTLKRELLDLLSDRSGTHLRTGHPRLTARKPQDVSPAR